MPGTVLLNWQEKLKSIPNIRFLDEDFYIFENDNIQPISYPFSLDMTICCICLRGEAIGRIDLQPYAIKASGMSVALQGQIMEHISNSADFSGIFILMSRKFTESMFAIAPIEAIISLKASPVIHLTPKQFKAINTYCSMVQSILSTENNPYRTETVKYLTIAFFYGIGYYLHMSSALTEAENSKDDKLLYDFIQIVQKYHRRERRLEFYAEKLSRNPKYLSRTIKNISGKSAAEWIDDYVILTAKALLKSTNMTVQQISYELNFPSQSFFGKYFKRLTGYSPSEYKGLKSNP